MGLYLCVFQDDVTDEELEGVEVGSYADFNQLRDVVANHLEDSDRGSRFPVLMGHDDSDGIWTPAEAATLENELLTIANGLAALPPAPERDYAAVVARLVHRRRRRATDRAADRPGQNRGLGERPHLVPVGNGARRRRARRASERSASPSGKAPNRRGWGGRKAAW